MALADCGTCGDPQTQHKGGKGGCRRCEFGCAEFAPDVAAEAAEKERVLTAVAEVCEDQAEQARGELGQQSTSARLREVERERDQIREDLGVARRDVERLAAERDAALLMPERLREEAVGLGLKLTGARETIVALTVRVESLGAELEHAEQYARDLQDNGDVPDQLATLLDRAMASVVPEAVKTAETIRGLFGQLRDQLAEHDRREELLTRREQLAAEIAAIDRELLGPQAADPAESDRTVRAWAVSAGLEVNPRGRIPDWLRDRYREAHTA
jgi:hypothetical protein